MLNTVYHNKWLKYVMMSVGAAVSAAGMNLFIVPAGLYSGGIMGACQLIRTALVQYSGMDFGGYDIAGLLYYLANIPLFIYCIRALSFKIVFNSLLVTTVYTTVYSALPIPAEALVDDPLTACLLGGICVGMGAGFYLTCGASGGGLDLLAMVLSKKGSRITVGQFAIMINLGLYGICLILFEPSIAIYSVIFSFCTSMVLDRLHQQNVTMQALIFTRGDQDAVAQYVMNDLRRGVTYWQGAGAYTKEETHILCVCLSKYEIDSLERVVRKADPHAFITVQEGVQIRGNYQRRVE